jgi:8-oxo-dGTP diphosphatase
VAVAVLFLDETDRVLLVRPAGNPVWNLPGRYLRPHEGPASVSVGVATELLGITPTVGRMLVVDWAPDPDDGFPEAEKVLFVFDGGRLLAETVARITPDPAAVAEHGFHDPELIPHLLTPSLARRVTSAMSARAGGQNRYLEIGVGGR